MEPAEAKKRVNRIALARFEQWALPRMAARLPGWMTPDKLSLIGLAAALGIGASYILTAYTLDWLWAASALFVVHWWADSLDGTLARVRQIQRERYGFYVDHQSDAVSTLLIFGGLGLSPLMELSVGLAIIVGYYLMMIFVYLMTITRDVFKISFAGVGPTEVRIVVIAANTAVWFLNNRTFEVLGQSARLFDIFGTIAAAVLLVVYAISGLEERAALAVLDPTPTRRKPAAVPGANGHAAPAAPAEREAQKR